MRVTPPQKARQIQLKFPQGTGGGPPRWASDNARHTSTKARQIQLKFPQGTGGGPPRCASDNARHTSTKARRIQLKFPQGTRGRPSALCLRHCASHLFVFSFTKKF